MWPWDLNKNRNCSRSLLFEWNKHTSDLRNFSIISSLGFHREFNMGERKRIPLGIFAVIFFVICSSSLHLLHASDDADDAVIHLLSLSFFFWCLFDDWTWIHVVFMRLKSRNCFMLWFLSDLLRIIWWGFWWSLDCFR